MCVAQTKVIKALLAGDFESAKADLAGIIDRHVMLMDASYASYQSAWHCDSLMAVHCCLEFPI